VDVSGGTLALGAYSNTVGAVTLSSGSITGTTGVLTGASYAVTNSSDTTTISAILAGSSGLTKTGAGTLVMSGHNTYTGGTTVTAGSLSLASNDVLYDGGAVVVNGGTLAIGSYSDTAGAVSLSSGSITGTTGVLTGASYAVTNTTGTTTISAALGGTTGLTKIGAGAVVMSGHNTYTGGTTVTAGTLSLAANDVFYNGGAMLVNGGTLAIGSYSDTVGAVTLSSGSITGGVGVLSANSYSITNATGTTTVSANLAGVGGLTKTGAGNLDLSGANSYVGTTLISAGTLTLSANNALSNNQLTSNGITLVVASGVTLPALTVTGDVTLGSSIATVGAQRFNSAVTTGYGSDTNPLTLTTQNGDVTFMSTLGAGENDKVARRSLTIDAGLGTVTFNDRLGEASMDYSMYVGLFTGRKVTNLYHLSVKGATINIKADITTLGDQIYEGATWIGDNGTNGSVRTLLSVDPTIRFIGTVDALSAGVIELIVKAITTQDLTPHISFGGAVGSKGTFLSLLALTDRQSLAPGAKVGQTDNNPFTFIGDIEIGGSVSTIKDQTYSANAISLSPVGTDQTLLFSTKNGKINFWIGKDLNAGITGTPGTKVTFKYSSASALSGDSLRNLKASGLKIQVPVFDYEDAARSDKIVRMMQGTKNVSRPSSNSSVSVGDAVIEKCKVAKDCQVN
jgi:autotransporter-associated beta strand protein